ncbi:glycosyltransferase [Sorangium sp. So ce1000]|uniref:glycosyltransferase n=1 Tax=Sorangium sp. So ce1000 TaxID=3133325 RepID=UPI003F61E9DC
MHVFVHLSASQDAEEWTRRWSAGTLIGINERKPYGYDRAEAHGCNVVFSRAHAERLPARTLRLGVRALLGFDLVHAFRNRAEIQRADVIWTHTESQHLGVLATLRILEGFRCEPGRSPVLIAQCVWLFDGAVRKLDPRSLLWRALLARADAITVLSSENLRVARGMFPNNHTELVRFGIRVDEMVPARRRARSGPLRIVAVGNDRHRDWSTLVAAVRDFEACSARIVSQTAPRSTGRGCARIELLRVSRNEELAELYDWADVAVVPLKHNLHASGITVIEEALVRGLPVVATDTGGLRSYFADDELFYCAVGDPGSLRRQLELCAREPDTCHERTARAQTKLREGDLNSEAYVRRHVELSRELFERAASRGVFAPQRAPAGK